jgi:(heptosyl)LPS beta-1,4-glucosyltransferase
LKGWILHRTSENVADLALKTVQYAMLGAEKYHDQQKKAKWFKLYLSPYFSFIRYYIFQFGMLDGWEGYLIARMNAQYIFLKYARLKELNKTQKSIK